MCGTDVVAVLRKLDEKFNSQSLSLRLNALKALLNTPKAPGESMESFLTGKSNLLRERLKGEVSGEELLLTAVLSNVGKELEAITVPLLAAETVTFDSVRKVLLEWEATQKKPEQDVHALVSYTPKAAAAMAKKAAEEAVAAYANQHWNGGKGKDKGKDKGKGKGKGKNDVKKTGDKAHIKCFRCQEYGHVSSECPQKTKGGGKRN